MKRVLLTAAVAAFVSGASAVQAETLEFTAGQIGGGWYTMASGMAKIIMEANPDIIVKVVPGGGTANPSKVNAGKSQLGMGLDAGEVEERMQRRLGANHYVPEARILELLQEAGFAGAEKFFQAFVVGGWSARRG